MQFRNRIANVSEEDIQSMEFKTEEFYFIFLKEKSLANMSLQELKSLANEMHQKGELSI